ncbi:MAG TPA: hypothetical protein VJ947_05700 [Pseudohaliea sp.]|nr:hypothetical protein [Pseudohaliea sp.]
MAEATSTGAAKATPKRKTTTRKRPAAKTTARRTTARKTSTARKSAPRRKAAPQNDIASRAREASRKAFLASLGFYGKAYDQVEEQFTSVQKQLEARRKKADKLYAELVKRGEKVEKQARSAFDDLELPKLDGLTDRKELEARLDKARERFSELKGSVGFKTAA